MGDYIPVNLGGKRIYTSSPDLAVCLRELDILLTKESAENIDIECIFTSLNYLKKYKAKERGIVSVIKRIEEIVKRDIESGKINLWEE